MFDLQAKLDERLKLLQDAKKSPEKRKYPDKHISKESIIESLKEAGILDKNGKMIDRVPV